MLKSGIYKITNKVNGKFYIGSSKNINIRFRAHLNELKRGNHNNSYFQNAWNKYGEENFIFEVVQYVKEDKLIEEEQKWLNKIQCYNRKIGYNIYIDAKSPLGMVRDEKMKNKIRGENNSQSKLNWERVKQIREEYIPGETTAKELAEKYNVSRYCIQAIIKNKNWYDENYIPPTKEYISSKVKKLTKEKAKEIRKKYIKDNSSFERLAKEYEVSIGSIQSIIENKRWIDKNYIRPTREQIVQKMSKRMTGENNPIAKLTEKEVLEIREKYIPRKYSQRRLAKEYNVSQRLIQNIVNGFAWKHI